MRLIVVGSGGSQPTPKAGCACRVCTAARRFGGRHQRAGPSLYVHEGAVLIDTPEEINARLVALDLAPQAVFWTHAHPDHAAGMRVIEFLAQARGRPVRGYVPHELYPELMRRYPLEHMARRGWLEVTRFAPERPLQVAGLRWMALRHAEEEPIYSYVIEGAAGRVLYAPDHYQTLPVPEGRFALAVLQVPRLPQAALPAPLPPTHPAFRRFKAWEAVLEEWRGKTDRLVFTHLYEAIGLLPEEYDRLARTAGDWVGFAHDGMALELGEEADPLALFEAFRARQEEIARRYAHDPRRMREEMRKLLADPVYQRLKKGFRRGS
ncbi:MBL fold metallo-hydrolase [Marinithermus hydrothermalis]|uniref:Beta-lactamase domain protein n=1 Tax=Marinithermus hydrothermalis (strain DSM 14884 / JCM 11576 / T1) TaxID=869210 RepID=F2NPW2_MARHT|nr:MBL fold metallo-hydrolase [Marinithermus hydrothermalis]AEB12888.1 beta-lactamase domain protein [Marinithermus hydrothermalis DSM 14884]